MKPYRKSDIEFHSDHWARRSHAAVNVKDYSVFVSRRVKPVEGDGMPAHFTGEFANAHFGDRDLESAWDAAAHDGWEQLHDLASEVFGHGYGVISEGRSGGWAVVCEWPSRHPVFSDDEVETWDAIAVSRWGRFARGARAIADANSYRVLNNLYYNSLPSLKPCDDDDCECHTMRLDIVTEALVEAGRE